MGKKITGRQASDYVVCWREYGWSFGPPTPLPEEVEVCLGEVDRYVLEGPFEAVTKALGDEWTSWQRMLGKPVRRLENFVHGRVAEDFTFDPKSLRLAWEDEQQWGEDTTMVLRVYAKRRLLPAEREALLKMAEERGREAEHAEREQLRRLEEKYGPGGNKRG